MANESAQDSLEVAKSHLERVLLAWDEPTDWSDLALYGFYCLEAAVVAASKHAGISTQRTHPSKIAAAEILRDKHGLPDISQLLVDLNTARKAAAYGDMEFPELDAEDLAAGIEGYVDAVEELLKR